MTVTARLGSVHHRGGRNYFFDAVRSSFQGGTVKWVTRERPKIDRIACPWLITRFIDKDAEFLFAPPDDVQRSARESGAVPYDVAGVELSHDGPLCSFDAFLAKYELRDPALAQLARIVRGADTERLDLEPQCSGLLAISLGLSQMFKDDHEQLRHGFVVYDALYAWLREARSERHTWNPQRAGPSLETREAR